MTQVNICEECGSLLMPNGDCEHCGEINQLQNELTTIVDDFRFYKDIKDRADGVMKSLRAKAKPLLERLKALTGVYWKDDTGSAIIRAGKSTVQYDVEAVMQRYLDDPQSRPYILLAIKLDWKALDEAAKEHDWLPPHRSESKASEQVAIK